MARNMMELDGLASVDALFGISGLKEDLMDVAILGASAGVALVGGELAFTKIEMLSKLHPYAKAGVAAAVGVIGGIAAGRYVNRGVGAGIAAGLLGWGVAHAAQQAMTMAKPLTAGAVTTASVAGLSDDLGASFQSRDYNTIPGQLGQAGNVGARDLQMNAGGSFAADLASSGALF